MYSFSMFPRTALVAVLLSIAAWLPAQSSISGTFDLASDREPVVVLDGSWRFHPGDDPDGQLNWADANFDDSTWSLIRGDKSWDGQGYENLDGFAWYRARGGAAVVAGTKLVPGEQLTLLTDGVVEARTMGRHRTLDVPALSWVLRREFHGLVVGRRFLHR